MQKKIDFIKLLKGYKSGWVGISSDFSKVVLWGKSLNDVMKKSKNTKEKIYFFPTKESYGDFIG